MAREKQSVGEQAAQFSLFAPIAVFFISVARLANHSGPGVSTTLIWLNVVPLVSGLGLGVAALFSGRRYGRRRILVQSVIGVALCGLGVLGLGLSALGVGDHARAQRLLIGQWQHPPAAGAGGTAAQQVDLTPNPDNTFTFSAGGGPTAGAVSLAGAWSVTRDPTLALAIDRVESCDDAQLVLTNNGRDEVFRHP